MQLQDNTLQALYFGALLVMLVYNGLIAVSAGSRAYAAYTLFLLSYGLLQCALGGFGYSLLWVDANPWADKLMPFFMICVGISSVVFTMILLDLRQTSARWFRFGLVVLILCGINFISVWFLPLLVSIQGFLLLTPIWSLFLLGSGIYLITQGYRLAQIYVAAWVIFVLGALLASSINWLPANALTINAMQIGSVIEFMMLSLALSYRIKTMQAELLQAQKKIAATLLASEQELEKKVKQRTAQLQEAKDLAENARQETTDTLEKLQSTQTQLIAAEKMASLGLLVSNVAHEINTPIGAVKSSGHLVTDAIDNTLDDLPQVFTMLEPDMRNLFLELIANRKEMSIPMNARDERTLIKSLTTQLQTLEVPDANRKAKLLIKLRAHDKAMNYLPLFNHPESDLIFNTATHVANIVSNAHNINAAVERVSRIVFALKALSGDDGVRAVTDAPFEKAIGSALAKLQNQMHSVDVEKNFQSDLPALRANHEALEQLCIHLMMNALQAMNYRGKLIISLFNEQNKACLRIIDSGAGIAQDIQHRIFEPFFTTRTSGEGSGMGLAIVKRIVEQHQGSIEVRTELERVMNLGLLFSELSPCNGYEKHSLS